MQRSIKRAGWVKRSTLHILVSVFSAFKEALTTVIPLRNFRPSLHSPDRVIDLSGWHFLEINMKLCRFEVFDFVPISHFNVTTTCEGLSKPFSCIPGVVLPSNTVSLDPKSKYGSVAHFNLLDSDVDIAMYVSGSSQ